MREQLLLWFSFQTEDGEDDVKKGTQLLEVYALEIQMYTAQKNKKKLKVFYCMLLTRLQLIFFVL